MALFVSVKLCSGLVDDRTLCLPLVCIFNHVSPPTFAEAARFLPLAVCGLLDDRAVGCVSLGQRTKEPEAETAGVADEWTFGGFG